MSARMEEIVEQARKLGRLLGENERVKAFRESNKAVQEDQGAQDLLKAYEEHVQKIRKLEAEIKPVEVEDKRRLADLERQLARNEALKQLMRTQADYAELMRKVNDALDVHLEEQKRGSG